jgi:magnesium-transporting ATPase (P-type)
MCKEAKNADGLKPRELFTKNHEQLMNEGRQWAKETASSFTIVGTLIITIMFAAAFTVPGGNDQNKGTPIFLGKDAFSLFILVDALSLVASSSSVLMFIGILTSRYAEEDFVTSLPIKLLFGLFTIFLSVLFMMFAFCVALALAFM